MTWSGRDTLLAEWLPRFHSRELLMESLSEYIKSSRVLDDGRCRRWLEQDLLRDQELAAIERDSADYAAPRPSLYALGTCYHCAGRGFVHVDVDPGHVDFGKAKPCPACSIGTKNPAQHCDKCAAFSAAAESRNKCWKCGNFEDEPAGELCSNPRWHLPNVNAPAQSSVPGWKQLAS